MKSCNKQSEYANYNQFGLTVNKDSITDPVAWSLFGHTLDSNFSLGPYGFNKYGLQSQNAQQFLAEKCAGDYDDVCEFVANDTTFLRSNVARISTPSFPYCQYQTVGQAMLDNAGQRRFATNLDSCQQIHTLFNELDPNSPVLTNYKTEKALICKPPANPDKDKLLNRILEEPQNHMPLLMNMYQNTKPERMAKLYKGTKIGHFFNIVDSYISQGGTLEQAPTIY